MARRRTLNTSECLNKKKRHLGARLACKRRLLLFVVSAFAGSNLCDSSPGRNYNCNLPDDFAVDDEFGLLKDSGGGDGGDDGAKDDDVDDHSPDTQTSPSSRHLTSTAATGDICLSLPLPIHLRRTLLVACN